MVVRIPCSLLNEIFQVIVIWVFFFFNDTATTEIYTLSLHDALPIYISDGAVLQYSINGGIDWRIVGPNESNQNRDEGINWFNGRNIFSNPGSQSLGQYGWRSEEHTSELQSLAYLVCRLLLEKKKILITSVSDQNVDIEETNCTIWRIVYQFIVCPHD